MINVQQLLNRYTELLKQSFRERLLSVAVFGSVARGTAKFPQSDIDILIVIEGIEKLSFGERIKLTSNVEEKLSKTLEYAKFKDNFKRRPNIQEIIFSPEELRTHPPILLDLTTDVIIHYDTGILDEELNKLRSRLKELGARRVERGDSWFWILKPDLKLGESVQL
ncbi:Nucleotidyltransferase domain protein [uncultured archaeon]|nr:Nucleotidyltransferase domain protein [uncultured archaeon]